MGRVKLNWERVSYHSHGMTLTATLYGRDSRMFVDKLDRAGLGKPTAPGSSSPWGPVQTIEELLDGVVLVTTAGHGGVWLSQARLAEIPAELQGLNRFGGGSWFEEDCEILICVWTFPDAFNRAGGRREEIAQGLAHWFADAWKAYAAAHPVAAGLATARILKHPYDGLVEITYKKEK